MGFEKILSATPAPSWATPEIKQLWINYLPIFNDKLNMVENLALVSRHILKVDHPSLENGIQSPKNLRWRHHENRVLFHPTSAFENKNWQPQKFIALAHRIKEQDLEPVFIMSKPEIKKWESVIDDQFPLHGFPTIDECTAFIYESGFFIGNDSGGGHLAANLNIPVLSIHGRKSKAQTWRPGWGTSVVVIPPINLAGGYLRQRYWKLFMSVNRVEKSFWELFKLVPASAVKQH
jgi:ADP-heptose:LPS heptosyltransferase